MVGFHSIDNDRGLFVFLTEFRSELYMGTFHLMVNGFSNVM